MKRPMLVGVALALCLALVLPSSALAAKPADFEATGSIDSIDSITEGHVIPAGNSGRWVVQQRGMSGSFGLDGSITGGYTLSYKANVAASQAGRLHGKLTVGDHTLSLNGVSQDAVIAGWIDYPNLGIIPKLRVDISGRWTMNAGGRGHGSFEGWFEFVPVFDGEGNIHIGGILDSDLSLSGKWHP